MDRRAYIGGTDVAPIIGLPAYRSIWDVWRFKTGAADAEPAGERMEIGLAVEPAILALGLRRIGVERVGGGDLVQHPRWAFLAGTPDLTYRRGGGLVVVDAKWTSVGGLAKDGTEADPDAGEVPAQWWAQLHHYAWLIRESTGESIDGAQVWALTPNGLRIIDVPLDLDWYDETVVPMLIEFWGDVTICREPRAPVAIDIAPIPRLDSATDAVAEYVSAARDEKAAKARKDAAGAKIMQAVRDAGGPKKSTAHGASISYWVMRTERIDSDKLRREWPEAAAACTFTADPVEVVRIYPKGETT